MALVNADTGEIVTDMTPEQARALTDQIKGAAEELWSLLLDAHRGHAWAALGYSTWAEYVRAEFDMARSRSYQLLDQGRVVQEISLAAGVSTSVDISEAVVRDIKPHLEVVTDKVREAVEEVSADEPERADVVGRIVRDVVTQERARIVKEREDREAIRDLNEQYRPDGFDAEADKAAIHQRQALYRAIETLSELPTPDALSIPDYEQYHLALLPHAHAWLTEFIAYMEEAA